MSIDKKARLKMIKKAAERIKARKVRDARDAFDARENSSNDERYWTDASAYAEQYYGDTYRATTGLDDDWG